MQGVLYRNKEMNKVGMDGKKWDSLLEAQATIENPTSTGQTYWWGNTYHLFGSIMIFDQCSVSQRRRWTAESSVLFKQEVT